MEKLRTPLFIMAMTLIALAFFLEIGASALASFLSDLFPSTSLDTAAAADDNPGLAIGYMALFDGLLLLTVTLIGLPLLITHALHARIQGLVTFIISLLVVITCIVMIFAALSKLMIMVGLLFAPIFGTVAYFALFASFPVEAAKVVLAAILTFKLGFAACLVFSHQRFLQNKTLVILTIFSILLGIVISFLHGFFPGFLVSITDAIGAVVVGIAALIWALFYLTGSIQSILRAVRV